MVKEDEKKRDEVLKKMLNTPSESNRDFINRRNMQGENVKSLKNKDSDSKKTH